MIVERWNRVVDDADWVVHLGDFGLGNECSLGIIYSKLKGRKLIVKGNHDRSVAYLQRVGFSTVLANHGAFFKIVDDQTRWPCGTCTFICATRPEDPRTEEEIKRGDTIMVSHAPLPNIKWPYFYGHIHNNPIPFADDYKPYDLPSVMGRNVCVEVTNYSPVPLKLLLHDDTWINKNWESFFREFFSLPKEEMRSK
jgi:calcineurin-like phosphoesterase family protein